MRQERIRRAGHWEVQTLNLTVNCRHRAPVSASSSVTTCASKNAVSHPLLHLSIRSRAFVLVTTFSDPEACHPESAHPCAQHNCNNSAASLCNPRMAPKHASRKAARVAHAHFSTSCLIQNAISIFTIESRTSFSREAHRAPDLGPRRRYTRARECSRPQASGLFAASSSSCA